MSDGLLRLDSEVSVWGTRPPICLRPYVWTPSTSGKSIHNLILLVEFHNDGVTVPSIAAL